MDSDIFRYLSIHSTVETYMYQTLTWQITQVLWSSEKICMKVAKKLDRFPPQVWPQMSIPVLFLTVQHWKQCPKTNERINKLCYIHTKEWYSAIKIDSTTDAHNNMDESQTHFSEQKKSGTKECKQWFHISKTLGKTKPTHNERKQVSACLELARWAISWEGGRGSFWSEGVSMGCINLSKLLALHT